VSLPTGSCKERRRWVDRLSAIAWPDPIVTAGSEQVFLESTPLAAIKGKRAHWIGSW